MTDDPHRRLQAAFLRRQRAARHQLLDSTYRVDESAGDDGPVTNYGKALTHRDDGVPTASGYASLVDALDAGTVDAYNAVELDTDPEGRRLAEPPGSHAFEGMGADPWAVDMAPPPAFASSEMGAELIELYCRALCRDVPFGAYGGDGAVADAVTDLDGLAGYAGPAGTADPRGGSLDATRVFRGIVPGTATGPHVSQLLWKDVPRGAIPQSQRIRVLASEAAAGTGDADVVGTGPDYLTDWNAWLRVQCGVPVGRTNPPPTLVDAGGDPDQVVTRHIVTGRDLANKVRRQVPYLASRDAAEILLGMGVPFDRRIPYRQGGRASATAGTSGIRTAAPVVNFGSHDVLESVVSVFDLAQTAAWYRKWLVHRRLRPEEYAGRLEAERRGARGPFDLPDNLHESAAPSRVVDAHGTALLPQAYTEGCPTHPSYPAGHSVVAGATVTVLKAMFDGRSPFPVAEMVVPVADDLAGGGTTTVQSTRLATVTEVSTALGATADSIAEARSETITVNDELNKLATNVALGRNWAGIHYRSDGIEGLLLGEQVAVRYLQDHLRSTDLPFDGYRLEPFFDAYPGTAEGAGPNRDRDGILLTPDRITTPDGESSAIDVDDPAR